MRTTNPIINKYLNVNGVYSGFKSDQRKQEIKSQKDKVITNHFPIREQMKNGENIFTIGKIKF